MALSLRKRTWPMPAPSGLSYFSGVGEPLQTLHFNCTPCRHPKRNHTTFRPRRNASTRSKCAAKQASGTVKQASGEQASGTVKQASGTVTKRSKSNGTVTRSKWRGANGTVTSIDEYCSRLTRGGVSICPTPYGKKTRDLDVCSEFVKRQTPTQTRQSR